MMLTTKGRYAVMASVFLAGRVSEYVSLSEISSKQGVALNYLEQIFRKLKARGIVLAAKGPGGGYKLTKLPENITLYDVTTAVEEDIKIVKCGHKSEGCMPDLTKCATHNLWADLEMTIVNYLKFKTLADVIRK